MLHVEFKYLMMLMMGLRVASVSYVMWMAFQYLFFKTIDFIHSDDQIQELKVSEEAYIQTDVVRILKSARPAFVLYENKERNLLLRTRLSWKCKSKKSKAAFNVGGRGDHCVGQDWGLVKGMLSKRGHNFRPISFERFAYWNLLGNCGLDDI